MIKVKGVITMQGSFEVELDMTEEEFDNLSKYHQNEEIADAIDWSNWIDNTDINDVDIYDLDEIEDKNTLK